MEKKVVVLVVPRKGRIRLGVKPREEAPTRDGMRAVCQVTQTATVFRREE